MNLKELLDRVIDLGGYINPEDPVYFINEKGEGRADTKLF